jgi:hypothetical protein
VVVGEGGGRDGDPAAPRADPRRAPDAAAGGGYDACMTRPTRCALALALAVVGLACQKDAPGTTPPPADPASGNTSGAGETADTSGAAAVPPAVPELDALAGAKPLGAKMWRRFGDGEWSARVFYVPGEGGEITIAIDMQGAGEGLVDPFELAVTLDNLELVEGSLKIPGRVPPGLSRRETLKVRAKAPGLVRIGFATIKDGLEAPGPDGCLKVADTGVVRCTESEAGGKPSAAGGKSVFCCAKGKGERGEGCEPIADSVDAMVACTNSKKFALVCDGKVACRGGSCTCE